MIAAFCVPITPISKIERRITMAGKTGKTKLQIQIETAMKRIEQEQKRLQTLENEQKTIDDKARTNRLCKRHGLLESFLPITIDLTDEQYEKFVKQHIANRHGINALANITGQTVEAVNAAIEEAKETKRSKKSASAKAAAKTANAGAKPQNNDTPTLIGAGQKHENQPPKHPAQNSHNSGNTPKQSTQNVANPATTQDVAS
jgi:hypothetical protein